MISTQKLIILTLLLQNGNLICGGWEWDTDDTCLTWADGSWTVSHNLTHARVGHVSWKTEDGVLLIGDRFIDTRSTTEMVTWQGTTEERFSLKNPSE